MGKVRLGKKRRREEEDEEEENEEEEEVFDIWNFVFRHLFCHIAAWS